jgi:hypothetical protein
MDPVRDERSRNDFALAFEMYGTNTPTRLLDEYDRVRSGIDLVAAVVKYRCDGPECHRVQLHSGFTPTDASVRGAGICPEDCVPQMKVCNGCMRRHYCSRECQVAHWPEHKKECKALATDSKNDES